MNKLVLSLGACLMGAVALGVENPLPKWAFGGFERPAGVNPVIKPNAATKFPCPMQKRPIKWEESDTFNPAATIKDGKIHVLYRAEDNTHQGVGSRTSRIGLAVSKDGGAIEAITGATITSRAVCAGVNAALACVAGLE